MDLDALMSLYAGRPQPVADVIPLDLDRHGTDRQPKHRADVVEGPETLASAVAGRHRADVVLVGVS
jgi:hypothetical protein